MSTTILSVIILLLSQLLPLIGVTVDSQALESAIQTIVVVITGITIWIQRLKLRRLSVREISDVNVLGMVK
jgi:uncharacterized membrane protein